MILDRTALFSDAQAITTSTASTNSVDARTSLAPQHPAGEGAGGSIRDIGTGRPIPLSINVAEGFNNLTSLSVVVQISVEPGGSDFSNPIELGRTMPIPLARLQKPGPIRGLDWLPRIGKGISRFAPNIQWVRLYYEVVGTAPTFGKITAGVSAGNQTNE